jgi:hypothetical protein
MIRTFTAFALLLILIGSTSTAQDDPVSIMLTDSSSVMGTVLFVRDNALIIQPDFTKIESLNWEQNDTAFVCEGAKCIPIGNISRLEMNRTSSSWIWGLIGGVALGFGIASIFDNGSEPPENESSGISVVPKFSDSDKASLVIASVTGILAAMAVHDKYGSDLEFSGNDAGIAEELRDYALFQEAEPTMLQELR